MRKNINDMFEKIGMIIGYIIVFFILYVCYQIIKNIPGAVKAMFDEYPTITVALITGTIAFVSTICGKTLEHKLTINNQIRNERQKIYSEILEWIITNVFYSGISTNRKSVSELQKLQKNITIYGSDEVLKSWQELSFVIKNSVTDTTGLTDEEKTKYYIEKQAPYIERFILAIRKELGYKNKKIKNYDILKLYITDINNFIK